MSRIGLSRPQLPLDPVTPPASPVWRVVHFPLTLLLIATGMLVLGGFVTNLIAAGVHRAGPLGGAERYIGPVVSAVVVIAVYVAFVRLVERRRTVADFAARGWLRELAAGYGAGLLLFATVYAIIALAGGFSIVRVNPAGVLAVPFVASLCTGFIEEIILRGLFFRLIERLVGSWIALAASAALFGAAHLANPNATFYAAVAIALEAGVMLAALYVLTRRLWAAIGLHAAWNFAQGGIFGVAVSGYAQHGLLETRVRGDALLTGGRFGAEASLPAIIVDTLFGVAILVLAVQRGRVVAPLWRRQRTDVQA